MGGQVADLSPENQEFRLRQLRAELYMMTRGLKTTPVVPNHGKRALRMWATELGTTVKSFRRNRAFRAQYNEWKEIYGG